MVSDRVFYSATALWHSAVAFSAAGMSGYLYWLNQWNWAILIFILSGVLGLTWIAFWKAQMEGSLP